MMSTRGGLLLAVCVALTAATVATYWSVWSCDFVNFDDPIYVSSNGTVLQGFSIYGWLYAWKTVVCGNWHPLTMLSLELDISLWGPNAAGFHFTNLVFHTLNVLLLFAVWYQMTGRRNQSGIVAAFFALHPLHVESVAWVSERKDVLSTFFLLLTMLAYVRYANSPSVPRYLLVTLLFVLGLLAKPMLVTLPILLLLLDQWPLDRIDGNESVTNGSAVPRRSIRNLVLEKVPLLFLSLADGIITILVQHEGMQVVNRLTFVAQLANLFNAYFWYLQKTFIPINLIVFYPHPGANVPMINVAAGVLIFIVLTGSTLWQRKRKPYLFFGWAWFVISLLPVIGLLQVGGQAYADRYSYIPHIGLFVGIVWEVASWLATVKSLRVAGGVAVLTLLAVCGGLSHQQVRYWKDSRALWSHVLDVDSDNYRANLAMASLVMADSDYQQAIHYTEKGLAPNAVRPNATPYYNWGLALIALGREAEAEEKFKTAIKITPDHISALDSLWQLFLKQQRETEADQIEKRIIRAFVDVARQQPYCAASQIKVGQMELVLGYPKKAQTYFEQAVKLTPGNADAYAGLAMSQLQQNRIKEAKASFLWATTLDPQLAIAHFRLGEILESERDRFGAKSHFEAAVRLEPSNIEYRQRLERFSGQQ